LVKYGKPIVQANAIKRGNNRVEPLLDAAASQFAAKGFRAATIRDIAAIVGMLPGSVYYHFPSKQALLLAVYDEAVRRTCARLDESIKDETDPWERLRKANESHLRAILDKSDYASVMNRISPDQVPDVRSELAVLRQEYEARFITLIDDIPLQHDIDRRLLRLMLLGAMNWTHIWFREGGTSIEEIARSFTDFLRKPMNGRIE
jgi:TetR/AcrR family transcriptional regulator, cholesterol catabolism regulator